MYRKTIGQCLALRARETPGDRAIEYRNRGYTWEEVHQVSDYLAIRMMTMGMEKGERAGIWSVGTPNWVLTFLALEKIGAVPVLLNPRCHEQELRDAAGRAKIRFLYYGDGCGSLVYESMADQIRREDGGLVERWVSMGLDSSGQWMSRSSFVSSEKSQVGHKRLNRRKNQVKPQDPAVILLARSSQDRAGESGGGDLALSHWSLVDSTSGTLEDQEEKGQDMCYLEVSHYHCLKIMSRLLTSILVGSTMYLTDEEDSGDGPPAGREGFWFRDDKILISALKDQVIDR